MLIRLGLCAPGSASCWVVFRGSLLRLLFFCFWTFNPTFDMSSDFQTYPNDRSVLRSNDVLNSASYLQKSSGRSYTRGAQCTFPRELPESLNRFFLVYGLPELELESCQVGPKRPHEGKDSPNCVCVCSWNIKYSGPYLHCRTILCMCRYSP